jgi:hypothetical protein
MSSKNEEKLDLSGLNAPAPEKRQVPPELLTPAAQAAMNANTAAMVRELFTQLAPLLKDISLSPEKLALMESLRRAPTEEQAAAAARSKREKSLMIAEANENAKNLANRQAGCNHRYKTGALSLGIVRNFPDRQPRGVCMACNIWLTPREWRIGPPSEEWPRGKEYIAPAHSQYSLVLEAINNQNS